jgi:cation:H+ antiporter
MVLVELLYQLAIFSISIVVLSKASQIVVDNSIKMARMTKIGELVLGFILLSVATSLPELAVSFSAITSGDIGISIGNLLGSNVSNLALVIGLPAIMAPIAVSGRTFNKLMTILFLSSIIPLLLLTISELSAAIGVFLIFVFAGFSLYSIKEKITPDLISREPRNVMKKLLQPFRFYKSAFLIAVGILTVILSARFVVYSASEMAGMLNIAQSVIGATIIAIGTSVPELSIMLAGVKKGHYSLVLGNTIGSCLTNITLILGVVLLMSPLAINLSVFSTLLIFVIASTMVTWYFFVSGRRIDRKEGVTLIFIYILFLIFTFGLQITLIEFFS